MEQVNFGVVRQNVIDEIKDPLTSGKVRQTNVIKPYHIIRNSKEYKLETISQTKKYQLVYNKRVIDPATFLTYPYGYVHWVMLKGNPMAQARSRHQEHWQFDFYCVNPKRQ